MDRGELMLFALGGTRSWGEQVAQHLGLSLAAHEEREFEDGEHKFRPLDNVRGRDVFVIHSLYGDGQTVNCKLVRLLFFLATLRDAGAGRITAVTPYLCYGRKDRRTKPRDPVTTRYVAQLFEAVGVDRVLTLDAHNLSAYQNAFRCPAEHLEARPLFVEHLARCCAEEPLVIVSPDVGGIKRAEQFRDSLAARLGRPVDHAFLEKRRSDNVVSGGTVVGEVARKTVVLVDDLISSGTTLARAAAACREQGATSVYAMATHGVFSDDADHILSDPALGRIVVTNTIPPHRLRPETVAAKLDVVDASGLFAEAIRRIHTGGSLVELLDG